MVISVFGLDHPGIVAGVSQILAEASCSIIDINQTVVQGKFAMVIIADTSRARESTAELKDRLATRGARNSACVSTRSEKISSTRCTGSSLTGLLDVSYMSEPEIARRCTACGVTVRERAMFCPQCGIR